MYKCKYCNKEFKSGKILGGHTIWCDKNPNRDKLKIKISKSMTGRKLSKSHKNAISKGKIKYFRDNPDELKRLAEIGRRGGFGTKGYLDSGIYYESLFEKQCFELIIENNINVEFHKQIPNSNKRTDIYLIDKDIWIELDGIDRERRKKWLKEKYKYWQNKIDLYKRSKYKYEIFTSYKDFKEWLLINII